MTAIKLINKNGKIIGKDPDTGQTVPIELGSDLKVDGTLEADSATFNQDITDPDGNTVTNLSDPVRVTEEASTFAESDVTVTNNNTTVSNGSIELSGSQTSGDALVAFNSGVPADIDSWDLATLQRTLDGETVTVDVTETVINQTASTIDDFESGDLVVENGDWSNWSGDTAQFDAQSNIALDGSFSAEITANNEFTTVSTSRSTATNVKEIEFKVQISSEVGNDLDGVSLSLSNSASLVTEVDFRDQVGTIFINNTDTEFSWQTNTTYSIRVRLDYENETSQIFVDGDKKGEENFSNSANSIDSLTIENTTSASGSSREAYVDSFTEVLETESTNVLFADISKDFDISTVNTSKNVKLRVNLSRNDTANNPTLDYAARRFTR